MYSLNYTQKCPSPLILPSPSSIKTAFSLIFSLSYTDSNVGNLGTLRSQLSTRTFVERKLGLMIFTKFSGATRRP